MSPPLIPSLSAKEALILALLGRSDEMYGLELVAAADGQLKRGTVYVTLGRMEAKGYVTSRLDEDLPAQGGLPRRLYASTMHGRNVLAAISALGRRLVPRVAR